MPLRRSTLELSPKPCTYGLENAAPPVSPESKGIADNPFPCEVSPRGNILVQPLQPCTAAGIRAPGCTPPRDFVQEQLNKGGKTGQKISEARDRVLNILQTENACTQWYRTKDPNPAATFRTLSFELDRKGESYIVQTRNPNDLTISRNPYVARVIQGNGSYATITINEHGAFFSVQASLAQSPWEGGPLYFFRGVHPLYVGPYAGNTLTARMLTLLHEFGHLLDLLPIDEADRDGKSVQNSMEVLRYCRAEIESGAKDKMVLSAR